MTTFLALVQVASVGFSLGAVVHFMAWTTGLIALPQRMANKR